MSYICDASSLLYQQPVLQLVSRSTRGKSYRVGAMTIAATSPLPYFLSLRAKRSRTGTRYAKVLPEPVTACYVSALAP